jgi:hypothetical protein
MSQGGGYLLGPDRQCWIAKIADQPLEFDAYPLRRPSLEADPVNVRLGISLREPRPVYHDFNTTRRVRHYSGTPGTLTDLGRYRPPYAFSQAAPRLR